MKQNIAIEKSEPLCTLATDIVYLQKSFWCESSAKQLHLSFIKPRQYYPYDVDREQKFPLLIFLCGGGWQKMDQNVWIPELSYFAKHGFAVASVEYSTLPSTRHPERLLEVKAAIRFLRKHAEQFHIIPDRFAIMGESAGAYLAALVALTGDSCEYKNSVEDNTSDAVQAAVTLYAPTELDAMDNSSLRVKVDDFPNLSELVSSVSPPFLMFHGTADDQVPYMQSEILYESLQKHGIRSDLYLMDGANHADIHFVQPQIKKTVLDYLRSI